MSEENSKWQTTPASTTSELLEQLTAPQLEARLARLRAVEKPGFETMADEIARLTARADEDTARRFGEITSAHPKVEAPAIRNSAFSDLEAIDREGDHLNAARFLRQHGASLLRSPERNNWYVWNGAWFEEDRKEIVRQLARDTVDSLRSWTSEATGSEFNRRAKHYKASSKASRIDGLISVAGTHRRVTVGLNQLDAKPLLLACTNGTVNLQNGDLLPATQGNLLTHGIETDYLPGIRSEVWETFLATTFGGDNDLIGYVQRLLGYCLTGAVSEQVLPVFCGSGANGKSTLIGVLQDLMGELACTAPEGLLTTHRSQPHPERIATLFGRRVVISSELEESAKLAEQTVKLLTGGDTLSGRELYGKRFNFKPTFKILLVSNHLPRVNGTDHAIWRRIRVIPFKHSVPPSSQNPQLRASLVNDHGAAVLAWLVEGAVAWSKQSLGEIDAVDAATDEYRANEDRFAAFLLDSLVSAKGVCTKVGDVYGAWRIWCEAAKVGPGRVQDLVNALLARDYLLRSVKGVRYVVDFQIR